MGFLLYDLTFLIVFTILVVIFLYRKRKNLKREGILYLYRTKIGIKLINFVGGKYKRTLKVLSYLSVIVGFSLMIAMIYLLGKLVYIFIQYPAVVKAVKVPPLMPLIPYLPSIFKLSFLPPFYFTYWIIAIAIIAAGHEFSHGIFAKFNKIKIKSTGFGFLGPFLAAFVEPDEKQMNKKKIFPQLSILSAGSFANMVMAAIFFGIFLLFSILTFTQAGATFDTYYYQPVDVSNITLVGNYSVSHLNASSLLTFIDNKKIENNFFVAPPDGNNVNLTQINANNQTFFISIDDLKTQLASEPEQVLLYNDAPAIKAGLNGVIIELNGIKIKNSNALSNVLAGLKPGASVTIKAKEDSSIFEYSFKLAENPQNSSKSFLGIASIITQRSGVSGIFYSIITIFREPGTSYQPRFDGNLVLFIYNLLWWIIIINVSVALVNMLPVGIFDGGRVFFLTMLALTKKEKTAKKLFAIATYIILFAFLLLMLFWFLSLK